MTVALFTLILAPGSAEACLPANPALLTLDPASGDEVAPAPPEVLGVEVTRGRGPREVGCGGREATSCDVFGRIAIELARPDGDPDGDDAVGYALALIDGTLPDGLSLPEPDELVLGPTLVLEWLDEAVDEQDPFDSRLALVPVDRAGNEGSPVEVHVAHDGAPPQIEATGCRTGPLGSGLGLLGLSALGWRRRGWT